MPDSSNFSYFLLVNMVWQLAQIEIHDVEFSNVSIDLLHSGCAGDQVTCKVSLLVSHGVLALDLVSLLVSVGGVGSNLFVVPKAVVVKSRLQMALLLFLRLVRFWINLVVFSWVRPVDLAVS
jgi:hypothetical protein